jgi:cell wall-associated NlpC family hydrolase
LLAVFSLVLAIVIFGGGAASLANAAPGLNASAVPKEYVEWVLKAGNLCPTTVGPAAIAAQIEAESNWNKDAVSPAGAQGIAQFMPGTWPTWAKDDDGTGQVSPFNPRDAIMAQGRYMCALAAQMQTALEHRQVQGDVLDLALAAYNAGPGAVIAAGGIPHNGETEHYVERIRNLMAKYSTINIGTPTDGSFAAKFIAVAESQIGKPYVWGGGNYNGPTGGGFDCSGLVMYAAFQASGGTIKLAEHLADYQARQGQPVAGPAAGSSINRALLRPGDIIGFADPGTTEYHHIAIYVGGGQIVHAPDFGQTVKVESLSGSYWASQIWNVRRLA